MESYSINTAQSGEEEDYIWISLHFESSATLEDRIHIVCATNVDEQDEKLGMNAIYLERMDQSQAGYGLATSILASESAVEIMITPNGLKALGFPSSLRLLWPSPLAGKKKAQRFLNRMRNYEWGRIVQVNA